MKGVKQLFIASLLLMLFACNPLKKLESTQASALALYDAGNYNEALGLYEQLIELYKKNGMEVPVEIEMNVGETAYKVNNYEVAKSYITKSFNKDNNIESLMLLIDISNQLSDGAELKRLIEDNINLLKDNDKSDFAYSELFYIDYYANDMEAAYSNYSNIESIDEEMLDEVIDVLIKLDKRDEAKELCIEMLKRDINNKIALEWLAIDEYTNAEKWYNSMMVKYNKNKNATSYAYLRRDLKKVSVQYRNARDKFVKLRTLDSNNKKYIRYLKNCYLRLEMKDKAVEMDKLLR